MTENTSSDKNPSTGQPYGKEREKVPIISTEALMNAPIGIFTSSPEGRIISANHTLARMLGYETPRELIESITDLGKEVYANSDDRVKIKSLVEEHGEAHGFECQWVNRSGNKLWVSIYAKAVWDEKGIHLFYQGFISDITDQKQAEEALKEQSQALNERNKELRCLYGISKLVEDQGNSIDDILQGTVNFLPDSWQYPEVACARIKFEDRVYVTGNFHETPWRQAQDIISEKERVGCVEIFYLEEKPVAHEGPFIREERDLIDAVAERLGHIIGRIRAQIRLQQSEQKFRDIFNGLSDAIFIHDFSGQCLEANQVACSRLGYSREELLHMTPMDLDADEFAGSGPQRIQDIDQQGSLTFESIHRCKDGSTIDVEISSRKINYDGKSCILSIARDITKRKQAEEALCQSETYYRALFETSGAAMFIIEESTIISHVNSNFEALLGYSKQEVEGKKSWTEFIHTGDVEWMKENHYLRRRDPRAAPLNYEFRFFVRNGELRHGYLSIDIIAGTTQSVVSVIDITERKQAEESLRIKSEEQSLLLDFIPVQIWYLKDAETYGALNKAHADFMGWSKEALANRCLDEFLSENEVRICKQGNIEVFEGKKTVYNEEWLRDGRGNHRLIALTKTPKQNTQGRVEYVVCAGVDITEKKEAEERLWLALQGSNTGLWDWYVQTGEVVVNEKWAEMVGYKPEELEPLTIQTWESLCHPDDLEISNRKLQQYFDGKTEVYECEVRAKHKDGAWVHVLDRGKVFEWGDDGKPVRMTGAHIDITERKQTEKEKDALQEQLLQSQKMESVGRLAGGVAHEFNNMLSIINGYAEMMADVLSPSEPLFDNAQKIQDAGKRSAVIIRKLLAFARKQIITPEVMNLNDSVSNMLKMLEKTIGENIDLIWEPEKNVWLIKMDFSQFDQILINLVVNSKDAISDVGEIIIETKNTEFDKKYCTAHPGFVPGQYVMLAVSDNGCGMSKEIQENLFEPFFTTKEMGSGTGLGLPTVYGIVKQNNGFVNVYSEPGEGTSFKVYFPRHKEGDAVDSSEDEEKSPVKGNGETILILEDEEEVLGIARLMLEKLGYKVLTAETPNKAMSLAEAQDGKIDLLISDVVMPEMNGRDFANQLKTLYPDVKTLFMSGYTDTVIAHHNAIDEELFFIEKPFTIKDIAAKVREALLS